MAKKAKEELDLFYIKTENSKTIQEKKSKSNKKTDLKRNSDIFDFENEIVIGMPRTPETKKQSQKSKQNANKKNIQPKSNNKKNTNKKLTRKQEIAIKKRRAILKLIKCITLLALIIGVAIYIILSPIFSIKQIAVSGNSKIAQEEILNLSELEIEQNTFKMNKSDVINKIKTNAYIENVKIRRKLPDKVEIIVVERTATYMLAFANSYIYINNQGYMLEITSKKADLPIITGYSTPEENLHEGKRLLNEDLNKLGEVLQIVESANVNEIGNLITKIDISNKQDYVLTLEKERKTIHMGDVSNLGTKMSYVRKIINDEKGIEGEIFVNTDLTNKGAVFREKV